MLYLRMACIYYYELPVHHNVPEELWNVLKQNQVQYLNTLSGGVKFILEDHEQDLRLMLSMLGIEHKRVIEYVQVHTEADLGPPQTQTD